MKNASIKCRSLSNFLTLHQTLKHHFSNFNVFVRDLKDITNINFSEPAGLLLNSDAVSFMKNDAHSFLSKEGVFTDFSEVLQALALTSNSYETSNTLLGHTHT